MSKLVHRAVQIKENLRQVKHTHTHLHSYT